MGFGVLQRSLLLVSIGLILLMPGMAKTVRSSDKLQFPTSSPETQSPEPQVQQKDMSPKSNTTQTHEGVSKWIILAPAIPTVFIFIFFVVLIALRNYVTDRYSFDSSLPNLSSDSGEWKKRIVCSKCCDPSGKKGKLSKDSYKKQLYDHMWQNWQEQTGLKKKLGQRKSSQIVLEGFSSSSPRTLARKHLALTSMKSDDSNRRTSALGTLVKLSSRAAMASTTIPEAHEESFRDETPASGDDKKLLLPKNNPKRLSFRELPIWQQDEMKNIQEESDEEDKKGSRKGSRLSRSSSSSSFKYRKLSRQIKVNAEEGDSDGSYDCAKHIQTIIGTSKDGIDSDDSMDEKCTEQTPLRKMSNELLPNNLDETLADMDRWPESAM